MNSLGLVLTGHEISKVITPFVREKSFSWHPPSPAFCSLSWVYAGIGMISEQDLFNPEMCLVFITFWKIFLELREFAYSSFLHMHSVHFNFARTKNFREWFCIGVVRNKCSLLSLLMDFYYVTFPPFWMRETLNRSTGYFICIRLIILKPLIYFFLFCL